ncbi:hypothetical protein BpHYR1_012960 [Brachionus plicatilis]|uniref:Uncharacterized protein n=1 Tax=Brachionus plicatilis TaxID=10195 RepID=A0A3M7RCJ5_BRAPC|nr:hypothetical protein BpHYR1_012960 [Brachionus plicatilis]
MQLKLTILSGSSMQQAVFIKIKQIIPLAELISTDQSSKSISIFFHFIYYNLEENTKKTQFSIAPIIVTDFSWASINAVLSVFNKRLGKLKLIQIVEEEGVTSDRSHDFSFEKEAITNDSLETIKNSSPFTSYYKNILKNYEEKLKNSEIKNSGKNIFFNPKLFWLIENQLYLLPIWSGLIIENFKKSHPADLSDCFKTRLSNNPVENYFGVLKNRILQNRRVFPKNSDSVIREKENWTDKKEKKQKKHIFEFDSKGINDQFPSNQFKNVSVFINDFISKFTCNNDRMEIDELEENENEMKPEEPSKNSDDYVENNNISKIYFKNNNMEIDEKKDNQNELKPEENSINYVFFENLLQEISCDHVSFEK